METTTEVPLPGLETPPALQMTAEHVREYTARKRLMVFSGRSHPQLAGDIAGKLGLEKALLPAVGTRRLSKRDMLHNDACPRVTVDPQTFAVHVDGELATCEPVREVPLGQRYMLR